MQVNKLCHIFCILRGEDVICLLHIFKYIKTSAWYYLVSSHQTTAIKTDITGGHTGSYWSCQNLHNPSPVPLASSAVLCLCASRGHPCPVSQWMPPLSPPRPLPVCFIKPVGDEVKSWRQHSRLVSVFRLPLHSAGRGMEQSEVLSNDKQRKVF